MKRFIISALVLVGSGLSAAVASPTDRTRATGGAPVAERGTTVAARQTSQAASSMVSRRWGVQLAGSFSKEQALASFARVRARHRDFIGDGDPVIIDTPYGNRGPGAFYRVRLPAPSQMAAAELCDRIRSAGGSCAVLSAP